MTTGYDNGRDGIAGGGPKGAITDRLTKPLAKRFYKDARAESAEHSGFVVTLDGRPMKTPAKRPLLLPTLAAAQAIADEWLAQDADIDPAAMPITRFANTTIDAVAQAENAVAEDIVAYAGRDLICYRADGPDTLLLRQASTWDPVLDWFASALDARFETVGGVMPIEQPKTSLQKIAAALTPHDPFRLTALHVMTTLTGSALLAIAHVKGFITAEAAWQAAHIDEDYQIEQWGADEEAARRRSERTAEFLAASTFYQLVSKAEPMA